MEPIDEGNYEDFGDSDQEREYVPKLTALEREYLEKAKVRKKENMTGPQIVMGREFQGQAFISKPDKIIFKDFVVGRSYKQTILITNVSLSFNSFKVLPIQDEFKDFFEVTY